MHSEKARDCKSVARFLGEATSLSAAGGQVAYSIPVSKF